LRVWVIFSICDGNRVRPGSCCSSWNRARVGGRGEVVEVVEGVEARRG